MSTFSDWIAPRRRLWSIYNELGYIPWRKPRKARKVRERHGSFMKAEETIPFLNNDAKRTFSHLLLRPGYMMRDYVLRGQHERYLAPLTALLVFYSVFTLIVAVVQPGNARNSVLDQLLTEDIETEMGVTVNADTSSVQVDAENYIRVFAETFRNAIAVTRLDLHPDRADTPWKQSLAAIEGNLRSKGIPMFLGNFLLLWITLSIILRRHRIRPSGTAAVSAYVLCQYCIFMFLALLLSLGSSTELGGLLVALLLWIDYRQLLGVNGWKAARMVIKTGLYVLLFLTLFFVVLALVMGLVAYFRVR